MKSLLNALQEGRLVELPVSEKEKALEYLAHILEAIPDLAGNLELYEAMLARERAQNTALELGVACPHIRVAGEGELLCAVGWAPAGIDYGASDGRKVHLVVMYYIPDSQKNTYLKEVSALAAAVKKQGGIESIAKAQDITTVRDELLNWVSAAVDAAIPEAKARMIRLEARQAVVEAAPLAAEPRAPLQIVPVVILAADAKPLVLCQNAELASHLEKDPALIALLKDRSQFDRAGYRLVFRSAAAYPANRTLYDYLAVKLG